MTECSASAIFEPLAATAPHAAAYVIIEQPGPWGREAVTDSHLPPDLAAHLTTARGSGTTVLLARHPSRTERDLHGTRQVWIGFTAPGNVRLRHVAHATVEDLLGLDFAAIAGNSLPALGERSDARPLFVCTHSGRDRCCALHGRALLNDLLAQGHAPESIWECSHLGGHRFAPTALAMPSGTLYGRLTPAGSASLVAQLQAGRIELAHYRGRSYFPSPLQAGEIAVRSQEDIDDVDVLDALWVRDDRAIPVRPGVALDTIASALVEIRHADGRTWRVQVRQQPLPHARLESCGREPVDGFCWVADEPRSQPPWLR